MYKRNEDRMMIRCMITAQIHCSFANIRESSRECITWYLWCLQTEPSYGKANPHTGHLTIMHRFVCLLNAINNYKVSTRAKHLAKPSRCSHVHLCILYSPKCQGDRMMPNINKMASRSPGLKYLGYLRGHRAGGRTLVP